MDPLIWHWSMNWIDVCRGPKTCRKSVIRNATEKCGVPFRAGAVFDAYQEIHIEKYLDQYHDQIECVSCGGESGEGARLCDYGWIIITKMQCIEYGVSFHFHHTGSLFKRGNRIYHIDRKDQEEQVRKSGIDTVC